MSGIADPSGTDAPRDPRIRFVVVASAESGAPLDAIRARGDVLVLDPMRAPDADLIGPLQPPIDGPPEIVIPRWAVYDCAEVPGAVVGLLTEPIESPCDRPLDPAGLVLATPHAEPGDWHLYGLTVRRSDGDANEIRRELVEAAMELLRARRVTLTAPWASGWLHTLAGTGRSELLAARTLLHGPGDIATVAVWSPDCAESGRALCEVVELGTPGCIDRAEARLASGGRVALAVGVQPRATGVCA